MLGTTDTIRATFEEPFLSKWILDVEILARFMKLKSKLGHFDVGALLYELPLPEWRDIRDSKLRATDLMRALFDLWPQRAPRLAHVQLLIFRMNVCRIPCARTQYKYGLIHLLAFRLTRVRNRRSHGSFLARL